MEAHEEVINNNSQEEIIITCKQQSLLTDKKKKDYIRVHKVSLSVPICQRISTNNKKELYLLLEPDQRSLYNKIIHIEEAFLSFIQENLELMSTNLNDVLIEEKIPSLFTSLILKYEQKPVIKLQIDSKHRELIQNSVQQHSKIKMSVQLECSRIYVTSDSIYPRWRIINCNIQPNEIFTENKELEQEFTKTIEEIKKIDNSSNNQFEQELQIQKEKVNQLLSIAEEKSKIANLARNAAIRELDILKDMEFSQICSNYQNTLS